MKKLFEWLFLGHAHKWVVVSKFNYIDTSYGDRAASYKIHLMCEVCKKHKTEIHYAEGYIQ